MPWTPVVVAVIAMIIALLLKRKGHDTGGLSIKKAAKWFVIAASLALVFWYGPYFTLGYGWGFVTTGHGGWSMASDDGIMPGSLTLHKAYASYEVGDDISFDYRGSNDPAENGRSVKRILAVNSDGTYRVGGTNELNSIMPTDIALEAIYGKIVWHHSFLPESYWRWMSMGWTLDDEDVAKHYREVVSFRTVFGIFTPSGRFRNGIVLNIPPERYRASGKDILVVFGEKVARYSPKGEFLGWERAVPQSPHGVKEVIIEGKVMQAFIPSGVGGTSPGMIVLLGDVTHWCNVGDRIVIIREGELIGAFSVTDVSTYPPLTEFSVGETRLLCNGGVSSLAPEDEVLVIKAWPPA